MSTKPGEVQPTITQRGSQTEWQIDLTGKLPYLGSGATLNVKPERLERFRRVCGAPLVCGYRRYVDWYEAAAFDVLLLSALAQISDSGSARPSAAVRRLWKRSGSLLSSLGFVSAPSYEPTT